MPMKNSNYTIGYRTRDLPTCRAVPQPTALPRAQEIDVGEIILKKCLPQKTNSRNSFISNVSEKVSQIVQNSTCHLKILRARKLIRSKFDTEKQKYWAPT
jgi:hypothetical protein